MKRLPRPRAPRRWLLTAAFGAVLGTLPSAQAGEWERLVNGSPGPSVPDQFHPARDSVPTPRKGGRVIIHLSSKPKNINYMVENSASTRRMLREVHETLVERDWETWVHRPVVAERWTTEDTVILKGGRGEGLFDNVLVGKVEDEGASYRVTPLSQENPLTEPRVVPKADVESVEYETAFTFHVRPGVKWHDGHVLDAHDIYFTYTQYLNPNVDCDQIRFKFQQLAGAEILDDLTIRFLYKKQYFLALDAFEDLTILPSHLYNLRDPDNAKHNAEASDSEQGTFINEHENNTAWVGLGPYQVTEFTSQHVDAERFDGYFDPENGGWVDAIRWRHIPSDDTTKQAVINGELDYWDRLRPEDYYGEYVKTPAFTERFYKGLKSYPYTGYITWNMRRSKFRDPNVRKALNHCFDHEEYIRTIEYGLASPVTGITYYFSPFYDRGIERTPFDLEAAEDLLLDAGWYDRDGDDIIDKDGEPFVIQFMMPTGNKASELLGQKIQENLAQIGIKMNLVTREWATFLEALYDRDYDCANLAWITEVESDPEQIWHSKWVDGRSSNHCGMDDEVVDSLIEQIQVELDDKKREALFHKMQARIYSLSPYLFLFNKPHKFVVSQRVRNFRSYAPDPGYRIRDWYIVEDDTAAPREAGAQ